MRRLYDWTLGLAAHPHALFALWLVAFVESSVFPIPPDVVMIPMILAARDQAWKIATIATLGSVLGGLFGYGLGAFLFAQVGQPVLDFYGRAESLEQFRAGYQDWGAWIVFGAGVTPFPYKVTTIASGAMDLNLGVFTVSSVLARGARFFMLAGLLWFFGIPIRAFVEKYLNILAVLFFALLLGGFALIGLL